ncbi:hypothetical protein L1049_027896 [Liquidambar formosana]|uniref:Uncharacterized protein n=1 Tax=Liquidambar formosana TaxID=63359 RepID=A0AAP0RHZ1_LIQFO
MGNILLRGRRAEVMKVDGETMKLKTPVQVWQVIKDYPGHVLVESEAARRFGIRAKPLEPQRELMPKKIYFLLEMPKFSQDMTLRRVRSGVQMSAKDRLESLMLSKRSVSDFSMIKPRTGNIVFDETEELGSKRGEIRLRLRLPRAQVAKLLDECKDAAEAAEKMMDLCVKKSDGIDGLALKSNEGLLQQQRHGNPDGGILGENYNKRRVRFIV